MNTHVSFLKCGLAHATQNGGVLQMESTAAAALTFGAPPGGRSGDLEQDEREEMDVMRDTLRRIDALVRHVRAHCIVVKWIVLFECNWSHLFSVLHLYSVNSF